jgi:glycosyltransferase involved in cell wall biosynthesis
MNEPLAPVGQQDLLLSVVIPTYNYAHTLSRAVGSVLPQLGAVDAELLIIDDGSTDDTPAVLDRLLAGPQPSMRAIRKANGGPASVRNLGIVHSRGRYLLFLDADDELVPDALQRLSEHIDRNPDSRMVIGEHYSVSADGRQRKHSVRALPSSAKDRVRAYLLDKTLALSNGACAMHREVFAPGDYPEALRSTEDIPVFAQILARYPCSVLHHPLAMIHKHETSLRHNLSHARAAQLSLIDEVFAAQRMPASMQEFKRPFAAQRCLSLFRTFQSAGAFSEARHFYREALRYDWTVIFNWSYTRKYLRMLRRA